MLQITFWSLGITSSGAWTLQLVIPKIKFLASVNVEAALLAPEKLLLPPPGREGKSKLIFLFLYCGSSYWRKWCLTLQFYKQSWHCLWQDIPNCTSEASRCGILPIQLPPNVLFTIFYYLPPKDSSPYNSFSPTIPPISIPPIYYHSLTNYLFNVFEFKKKSYNICTVIIHIIIVLRGSNGINIVKKRCD